MSMEVSLATDWWVYGTCTTPHCDWVSETYNPDESNRIIVSGHEHDTIDYTYFYFVRAECFECNMQTDYIIDDKELQETIQLHNFKYHNIPLPELSSLEIYTSYHQQRKLELENYK
jgi:hypothetical protein